MADSVINQKTSNLEPYNKQTEVIQPSKKTIIFALLIIAGIGGVTAVAFGGVGLGASPAWIVSVIGKEGCLTLIIGGAVIGGVGIGGGICGLKKAAVEPKKENQEEVQTIKVDPIPSFNDQISKKLPKLSYTYISNLGTDSYDFYSKNSVGSVSKKENLTLDQVNKEVETLNLISYSADYKWIPQNDLELDTY